MDYDSCNKDKRELAMEQFYRPGSILNANTVDNHESLSCNELQPNTSLIKLAKSLTKQIECYSPAVSSHAMTVLHLSHSTCSFLQQNTESQPQVRHSSCQKLLRKRKAESQYRGAD